METSQKINTVCLFILTIIAIAFVLSLTKSILIPFTLSIFIALVFAPVMNKLQKKLKVNRLIVLALTFMTIVLFFVSLSLIMAGSIESFASHADQYKDKVQAMGTQLTQAANSLGYQVDEESIKAGLKKFPLVKIMKGLTGSMLAIFSNTFLVIIFTLFLLSGESLSTHQNNILEEIKLSSAKYVGTKLATSGATGLLTYLVLKVFGVEMSFMFATLTFLLNFIPTIGSIIAVILPVPIMLLQFGFSLSFFGLLILLGTVQMIIGNVVEPKMMGESTGLHPITVLLSLTFWGLLWGVTGMFLSVPITATLKIVFSKFELTRPIADAFSGEFKPI